jgi:hypothetical protein
MILIAKKCTLFSVFFSNIGGSGSEKVLKNQNRILLNAYVLCKNVALFGGWRLRVIGATFFLRTKLNLNTHM